jgi:peroxiredoxin Q/BCP
MLRKLFIPCLIAVALICAPSALAQDGAITKMLELKVGDKAPDFKLLGSDGKTYTLSQFKGKKNVVLAFFPKSFTPG